MKILIIANARRKGGLSGSDNIYDHFIKHWPATCRVWQMVDIDYKPFWLCYLHRILLGCFISLIEPQRYDFVYSASDFLMDSLPAFIMKLKGNKWVAGFFFFAPKSNKIYYWTQALAYRIIKRFADVVIVTNPSMLAPFFPMKMSWINGGINFNIAGPGKEPKVYDAVFCGRIHKTKGIDELINIWSALIRNKPDAKLAIVGDGDMGMEYIRNKILLDNMGIYLFGYMGDSRFDLYRKCKVVIYPTPVKYDHFSMAPVEAMACGCPCFSFRLPVLKYFQPKGWLAYDTELDIANSILNFVSNPERQNGYNRVSGWAVEFAKEFEWGKECARVWEDITKGLK